MSHEQAFGSIIERTDELTVEKLAFHPAITKELERLRGNHLNKLRTTSPNDIANIAIAQAGLAILDLLLGVPGTKQLSLAESLVHAQTGSSVAAKYMLNQAPREPAK